VGVRRVLGRADGCVPGGVDGGSSRCGGGGGKDPSDIPRVPGHGGEVAGGAVPGLLPTPQPRGGAQSHGPPGRGWRHDDHPRGGQDQGAGGGAH
ncbi:unnamed protein product, partial [Ectocarpus sp. 12 AP-2014]